MTIAFDLNEIVNGNDRQTNFTTMLLKLIFKADISNRQLLSRGFPQAVTMVQHYVRTGQILDKD